jgi:hypothetical protein
MLDFSLHTKIMSHYFRHGVIPKLFLRNIGRPCIAVQEVYGAQPLSRNCRASRGREGLKLVPVLV